MNCRRISKTVERDIGCNIQSDSQSMFVLFFSLIYTNAVITEI